MSRKGTQITEIHEKTGVGAVAEAAIDSIIGGASITDAAASVGITRETLSRWLHRNPIFMARLNERRAEVRDVKFAGLISLIETIEEGVKTAFEDSDVPAAVKIQSGLSALPKFYAMLVAFDTGTTNPETVARKIVSIPMIEQFDDLPPTIAVALMEAERELQEPCAAALGDCGRVQ
ncbi:hypothetical protein FACS1894167_12230 [Synergistales bacterium]|nr:hypothetical protein FACS1894167_12230 [Synergistales bacterium]